MTLRCHLLKMYDFQYLLRFAFSGVHSFLTLTGDLKLELELSLFLIQCPLGVQILHCNLLKSPLIVSDLVFKRFSCRVVPSLDVSDLLD
jgi:hypothetical protein